MNNRFWPGLLLLTFATLAPARIATAQAPRHRSYIIPKQSHHDLPGGIDLSNPEELLAQRLADLHELHQLQDRVQELLNDDEFRKQLGEFPKEKLEDLRKKLIKGEGLSGDTKWKEFLQQPALQQKLDKGQVEKLRQWFERNERKLPAPTIGGLLEGHGVSGSAPSPTAAPSGSPMPPSLPSPLASPERSLFDRIQDGTTKWLMENFDDVGDSVVDVLADLGANDANTPFGELLRSMHQPDFSDLHISEQAMGLSRSLSEAGDFLHRQRGFWDDLQSVLNKTPTPSLPDFGGSPVSVHASSASNGDGWGPAVLFFLLFAAIVVLLCKQGLGLKSRLGSGAEDEWRLGPWPVPPDRIATRQDVIRAFEHLALLCLGPAAGACHHRELAERLAELPPRDGGGEGGAARRQAAEMLAWLYEQARYAPAEALSADQFRDARLALCLLAGVTSV